MVTERYLLVSTWGGGLEMVSWPQTWRISLRFCLHRTRPTLKFPSASLLSDVTTAPVSHELVLVFFFFFMLGPTPRWSG
jgi:hypothetical protein